jgi:hypothetical protein
MAGLKDAVAAIRPSSDRLKEAQDKIAFTVESLQDLKKFFDGMPSAGQLKLLLDEFCEALRKAELAGKALPKIMRPDDLLAKMESHRQVVKDYAAALRVPAGAKRRDPIKANAATLAHELLVGFERSPGITRDGPWHKLANALYALATNTEADLFAYLRDRDVGPTYDAR